MQGYKTIFVWVIIGMMAQGTLSHALAQEKVVDVERYIQQLKNPDAFMRVTAAGQLREIASSSVDKSALQPAVERAFQTGG